MYRVALAILLGLVVLGGCGPKYPEERVPEGAADTSDPSNVSMEGVETVPKK